MACVTPDCVRDRVNLSSADISDSEVTEFIKDAEAEIELETDLEIDYTNCTQAEASCITDLAALHCLTYPTGGCERARGYTFFLCAKSFSRIATLLRARIKYLLF